MLPTEFESIARELRARFHAFVLADTEAVQLPELLTAQETVLAFTRLVARELLQDFVCIRSQQALATRAPCPSCGRRMEVLQQRSWLHETLVGSLRVPDPVVYCRSCHETGRPAQAWLGTDKESWSLLVQEAAVDLATDESCQKAVAKLARHHPGVTMGRTTALRMLHRHGARARTFIDDKIGAARARAQAGGVPERPALELEVEFDGGMIPVATLEVIPVAEGEKPRLTPVRKLRVRRKAARFEEVKAGLAQIPRHTIDAGGKPALGEAIRLYSLRPTGALDEAFDDLFGLAGLMGWTPSTEVRGLADGALHIRPRMEAVFAAGPFQFILDRPHCKEHLSTAGAALHLLTGVETQTWARAALVELEAGHAADVVAELRIAYVLSGDTDEARDDTLRLAAGYFDRNHDAVAYADYRARGWGTASSEIESIHRHGVQARMKISGAWWHPDGVDDILALRILRVNGWWDEYWTAERTRWRKRAERFSHARPTSAA